MATLITSASRFAPAGGERGFFARAFARMVEARQRQADRIVAAHLLTLGDAELAELGHRRAELKKVAGVTAAFI
jgi:hypothetical protein